MTLPLTPGLPDSLGTSAPSSISFPLSRILDTAAPPVQYRATTEVARIPASDLGSFALLPYTYLPALRLALMQDAAGTWSNSMLTVPTSRSDRLKGVGTIHAVRRLLEYGWEAESPPVFRSRRILFRLLAEDDDPSYLFDLALRGRMDIEIVRHARAILRDAAAAVLAQAGYERDPRLRGAARRVMQRMDVYLQSPLAQKPFIRVGNHHVLSPEAAPPSFFTIVMLAYMPLFRSEHYSAMEALFQYLSQPTPRPTPASVVGSQIMPEPHLVLGDPLPHRNAADADVPAALVWLELFARLDFLRRNEVWSKLFDRFLDDRDANGLWRPPKRSAVLRSSNPHVWPSFPLGSGVAGEELWSEVTFRLGLIARLTGMTVELS
ncbi:MAG TPA: hypothetical protein VFW98_06415 [Gemmatimonadaceae bacterium]|nr:hypothetical protein [Gemmatimonadaceae bacterium]